MCGIAGFLTFGGPAADDPETIGRRMARRIAYRGPNDEGVWADRDAGVCIAHRRLSIIDLSPAGHQPMHSVSGRYAMVFNGEIYNHASLREELEQAGAAPPWRGHSDTETLLAAFELWGVEATIAKSVGMFAIALWDRRERRLILARDRLGEKPLYYGWLGEGEKRAFVFASELKAIRAYPEFANAINRDALSLYFQFGHVPAPHCIYADVFKIMPAHLLSIRVDDLAARDTTSTRYWNIVDEARRGAADPINDETAAIAVVDKTLRQAVALQAMADVPLGAFLSGGVDSSTIVALMQAQSSRPILTFTIGFDEPRFNEAPYARAVARHLGTDHHEVMLKATDALDVIPGLPAMYDEPFADSSQIPTYLVSKMARRDVTVALSGDAGDELFGGYYRYISSLRSWQMLEKAPFALRRGVGAAMGLVPEAAWNAIGRSLSSADAPLRLGERARKTSQRLREIANLEGMYRSVMTEWLPDERIVRDARPLPTLLDDVATAPAEFEPVHRMMLWDSVTYLPNDILVKVDRAAMNVSLETRAPMLDHRLVELAWRLPMRMKFREGQGKWILRQTLYQYVPRDLIERPKAGFSIPLDEWLRGPLRDWAENLLDERRLEREGFLDVGVVREAWRQHLGGMYDWGIKLWIVLMFQAWLETTAPEAIH